jgi:hypothetical protein
LLGLYEGGAHAALGYDSWGDYYRDEFDGSRTHGYELLTAGRVSELISQSAIADSAPQIYGVSVLYPSRRAKSLLRPENLRDHDMAANDSYDRLA